MSNENKQFAVIGLGRFGISLCTEFARQGIDILAIDVDPEKVNQITNTVQQAVVADCSIESVVKELKLDDYDTVMVAIGDNLNSSIMATLILKELGIKNIWVKAKDQFHRKVLSKIGADRVIQPEHDMGISVAQSMIDKRVFNYLPLGSGLAITEIIVLQDYFGVKLGEHPFVKSNKTTLLGYKHGPEIIQDYSLETPLEVGDILILTGLESDLMKITHKL